MKKAALGVLFTLLTLPLMAQKRLFTINDLIPGGSTYYQASMPETEYLTWWGDACIKLDMSHCQQFLMLRNHTFLLTEEGNAHSSIG